MLCEEGHGFRSREYRNYKPYTPTPKGHDWRDEHDWICSENGVRLEKVDGTCNGCHYRKYSCMDPRLPRYYCHKSELKSRQTTLGDYI